MHDYIQDYYDKIVNNEVVVGKWIRLFYDWLIKQLDDGVLQHDIEKSNKAIDWIEAHTFHVEGPLAPGPFLLEVWEKALISVIFGIINPTNDLRAFREVVLLIGRKNGKSILASAIANYVFREEGGFGARVYNVAPKIDQADIVYMNAWTMALLDPDQVQRKETIEAKRKETHNKVEDDPKIVKKRASDLYFPETNSTMKKIAFSAKRSDGFNPSLAICDELAAWEGDNGLRQYEVMRSGFGARPEGLLFGCTTAGYISDGIYDELIKRSTRFLLGDSGETRIAPFLYMIDDLEKWNDIEELKKANPNLGVSISEDYMLEEIAVAEGSLSKKAEFLTKYANIKQNSSLAWLDSPTIEKATGEALSLEDFRGCYCVGGVDLSRTTDLTACTAVIEKDGELYVFAQFYLPAEKIDEAAQADGVPYGQYVQRGLLIPSGDNFIDYRDCFEWYRSLVEDYEIYPLQVGYDRYCAQYLVNDMKEYGFHMDDVFQGTNLYPVIQEFEGLMKDHKIHIGDNDLLKIHLFNAAVKLDTERNRGKLAKINPKAHIDGVAALLDAMTVRQKWYGEIGGQLQNNQE